MYSVIEKDYEVFSMYQDMYTQQRKSILRSLFVRERGVYIFDPEEFKRKDPTLTIEIQRLSVERLHEYAVMASKIRRDIS